MAKLVKDLVENAALLATMQGGYVPKQEIARLLGLASVELFNFYYGKPTLDRRGGRVVAYQVSTQVSDALQPFLKEQVYSAAWMNWPGDLPIAARSALADRIGARGTGDSGDINGTGRDGKLLFKRKWRTLKFGDRISARFGDVSEAALRKDADGVRTREQSRLENVFGLQGGRDVEGGERAVSI